MASIYDVKPNELIELASKELEKMPEISAPEWALYVKTGMHKERPPVRRDWWFVRSAAVLRAVYKLGPIGVSKLRKKYGGRKNRGVAPDKSYKGSGNIIRKVLQQLEKAELVKQTQVGVHKGRVVTAKGRSFLDKIATGLYKSEQGSVPVKEASVPKEKKVLVKEDKPKPVEEKKPAEKKVKQEEKK